MDDRIVGVPPEIVNPPPNVLGFLFRVAVAVWKQVHRKAGDAAKEET